MMTTQRRMKFVWMQTGWMLAAVVLLVVVEMFSLELFFFLASAGLLVVAEFTARRSTTPVWRQRLRWLIALLILAAAALLVRRILRILPQGVF